eukprot:3755352-Amphidinium_carterae.1
MEDWINLLESYRFYVTAKRIKCLFRTTQRTLTFDPPNPKFGLYCVARSVCTFAAERHQHETVYTCSKPHSQVRKFPKYYTTQVFLGTQVVPTQGMVKSWKWVLSQQDQVIVGLGASSDAHFPDDGATLHANHIPENDAVGE